MPSPFDRAFPPPTPEMRAHLDRLHAEADHARATERGARFFAWEAITRVLGQEANGRPIDIVVGLLAEEVERLRDRLAALERTTAPEEETP